MTIQQLQKRIWANKIKKGFNTTQLDKEFLYLIEELGEAVNAFRKRGKNDVAEEIVDLIIYCFGILEMLGKNGYEEIMKKVKKNEKRKYKIAGEQWQTIKR